MQIGVYTHCCKARILYNFGAGHLSEADEVRTTKCVRDSKEKILDYLKEVMPRLQQEGVQVLFACPTNHQPEAIEALTEFGFYGAPEEELKKNAVVCKIFKDNDYTSTSKPMKVDHIMVPLFYLVPPSNEYKELDYT